MEGNYSSPPRFRWGSLVNGAQSIENNRMWCSHDILSPYIFMQMIYIINNLMIFINYDILLFMIQSAAQASKLRRIIASFRNGGGFSVGLSSLSLGCYSNQNTKFRLCAFACFLSLLIRHTDIFLIIGPYDFRIQGTSKCVKSMKLSFSKFWPKYNIFSTIFG